MEIAFRLVARAQVVLWEFVEKISKFIDARKEYEYRFTQTRGESVETIHLFCTKSAAMKKAHDYCLGKNRFDEVNLEKVIKGRVIWSRTFSASEICQGLTGRA